MEDIDTPNSRVAIEEGAVTASSPLLCLLVAALLDKTGYMPRAVRPAVLVMEHISFDIHPVDSF